MDWLISSGGMILCNTVSGKQKPIKQPAALLANLLGANWALWLSCLLGAAVFHFSTAVLRLGSLFPVPQALDFSSYYAGAWSVRLNRSPYSWSEDFLAFLFESQGLTIAPPTHNSPPLWSWLLQPITMLPFPFAAVLWLSLLLLLAVCSHALLVRIAGYNNWKIVFFSFPITLTFGPLFLTLTLGQNAIVLLLSALLLGRSIKHGSGIYTLPALTLWIIAVAAKVYPVLWIIGLLPSKRWRTVTIAATLCLVAFGASVFFAPSLNAEYWFNFLPGETRQFTTGVGIDDQSLNAFLTRIGGSTDYFIPGLNPSDRNKVTWSVPWQFSTESIQYCTFALLLLLGAWLAFSWIHCGSKDHEGILYSMVLFSLLLFPHMERYNHILALPAMAWLWKQGIYGRHLAVTVYGVFGLSRLNHLWALFPFPVGPLASGLGLFGALILIHGLARSFLQCAGNLNTGPVTQM
jgi:hypothetical protein